MQTIFTKIIQKEIPAFIVNENSNYIAFLDAFPIRKAHVLVCPKMPVDQLFDLPEKVYQGLWGYAKKISFAIKDAISCERVGVYVEGTEVPHAHIHLFPITPQKFDLSKKIKISPAEKEHIRAAIADSFEKLYPASEK